MSSQRGHGEAESVPLAAPRPRSGSGAGAGAAAAGGDAEGGGGGGAASSASSSLSSSSSTDVEVAPAPPARAPATTGPSEERCPRSEVEDILTPRVLDALAEGTPNRLDDGEELSSSDETSCSSSSSGDSECEVTGHINRRKVQLIISKEPRRLQILNEEGRYDSCWRPYRWTGSRTATFTAYTKKGGSSKDVSIKLSAADMRKIDQLKGLAARLG